ncbi:type III secretion system chaperone [Vibrio sp. 1074]|uniref:type III secretion system chaperone n=1 Tax=Vibrio sp. 1074 TaxID=3074542 RepID=UPI002963F3D9|nr:type III secretion system chaperone [Vibrio sp. 1074]
MQPSSASKTTKIGLFSRMANGFITSLLTDFASRCQLEPLVFDEDDCCHLLVEQNTAITIRAQEDRVTLIGLISGDKPSADILHQHMKGALTQGSPAVCWEEETGYIGFIHLPQQLLTASFFDESFANFIEWLKSANTQEVTNKTIEVPETNTTHFSTLRV